MPFTAPGKEAPFPRRVNKIKYGNKAVKYAAFPELLTPFTNMKNKIIHEASRQRESFKFGGDNPSLRPFGFLCRTSFLSNNEYWLSE